MANRKYVMTDIKRNACECDAETIAFYRRNPVIACRDLLGIQLFDAQAYMLEQSWNETNQVELRNTMNTIYDKNYENKSLTLREKESLVDLFDRYSAIGGNHGMKFKFDEMMSWEIRN